ncbi:hypothetical protein [Ulvibacterium marinum]|uniref:hypothetical protein n=1 Tax=Ulvibacterium marinum TaxID=2419782 RepID=UPI002494E3C5|nr:hypothetical protein [Ulvibacterium marinum]
MTLRTYKYGIFVMLLLYYIVLSYLNFSFIIDANSYLPVAYNTESTFEFLGGRFLLVTLVLLCNLLIINFSKVSDFGYAILILILIFFVIPSGLLYASNEIIPEKIFFLNNLLFYSICFFLKINWKINTPILNKGQAAKVLLIITAIGVIPFIYLYGPYIDLSNLLLINIYKTRALVEMNIQNSYTAYTYSWYSKIILPVILVFFIYFRSRTGLIVSFAFLLFFYLCGAHKTVFLGTIAILVFYKFGYLKKTFLLVSFLCIVGVMGLLFRYIFEWDYFATLTLHRIFMLNALLDYCFFDFFNNNPIYWSDSFMASFIEYPYDILPSNLIGREYLNNAKMYANTGIIANGYKNAGITGTLINIFIVSVFLSFMNSFKISPKFFGLFLLLMFTFTNASLAGSILTHGLLVLFVICMYVLRNTQYSLN